MRPPSASTLLRSALAAALAVSASAGATAAPRQHVVLEIRTVPGAAPATVTLPNGRPAPLAVKQSLPDGARIDVPLRVTVVIASTDAKSTTTLRPDTTFTLVETGAGERSTVTKGGALFSVVHGALDFFQVKYGNTFTASARGTIFSVDASAKQVTFSCKRGTIDVAYAAKLRIGGAGRVPRAKTAAPGASEGTQAPAASARAPYVRAVDVITSTGAWNKSFATNVPSYVATFGTADEARTKYDAALAAARASGDRDALSAALNNRGVLYDDDGDRAKAMDLYNEAIKLNPSDPLAYYNRANIYYEQDDYTRSLADLDEAIRLNPRFADAYSDRGDVYDELGKYDRALADYAAAIRLNPGVADFYYNRAITYADMGDVDRSIADNGTALRLDPRMTDAYLNRGRAYAGRGNLDGALADFTDALQLRPAAFVYDNRGLVYSAKDDRTRALADFDAAVRLAPAQAYTYLVRGLAYLDAGPLDRARADFTKALSLAPMSADAMLLQEIADRRAHAPSRLADAAKRIPATAWPAPLVRLYLGQTTPAAALAAAQNPNPSIQRALTCSANYYTAQYDVLQGAKDDAARLFRAAAHDCPDLLGREPARAALKALGAASY